MSLQTLLAQLPPPRRAPRLRRDIKTEITVLALLMRGYSVRAAAVGAGISEGGVRSWIKRDPVFRAQYHEAVRQGQIAYVEAQRSKLLAG